MKIFEVIMLICFGIGWPVSVIKTLRTKTVSGKSPLFMGIVWAGYLSGICHKIFVAPDWVIVLYFLNMAMISADLVLYFKYAQNKNQSQA
ncbi:MAG: hypothetical protein EHM28_02760 [Spirochaetaceae bacterium]|nr:MAG: hypothetical protein EHM28_02760 [Spirochaetaceae bacterium]